MALQNFVDFLPPSVKAAWLNGVDALKFTVFDDAITKVAARTALQLDTGTRFSGVDGGVVNAAVVTIIGPLTSYVRAIGVTVSFLGAATNTGAATLNVNGTGVAPVINQLGNPLTGGELSYPVDVQWTGAAWKIINGAITPDLARGPAEISAGITPINYIFPRNWVTRYGALGDRVNDDLAAFNRAAAVAAFSKEVYIPPVSTPGFYYRLTGQWTLGSTLEGATVHGVGIPSLLVIANNAGQDCIRLDGLDHAIIRDIGIYGTSGSGSGINLVNSAHRNSFVDIWCGWTDASAFRVTLGISNSFTRCKADQNNGFRPASLIGGLVDGSIKHGFYVLGTVTGLNNNQTFVDCHVDAAGETMSVQIGDGGVTPVDSCTWTGGLIQGSGNHRELYLVTRDCVFDGAHIEPPVGASANWPVTLDGCTNTVIKNCGVQGDIRLIGACQQSGFQNIRGYGIDFGTGCDRCFIEESQYGGNNNGPAAGNIKDAGFETRLGRLINAANARFAAGMGSVNPVLYFSNNMEDWVLVAGVATIPCGFTSFGTPTITRDSTPGNVRSGSFAAQIVCSSSLDEGFQITLAPSNQFAGRSITVEAWVRNSVTAGLANIAMLEGGTGAQVFFPSFLLGTYERMLVTFKPDAAATSVTIRFTGGIGTMDYDSIKIWAEEHSPINTMDMDTTTTTPAISFGGYHVPTLVTAASANSVTNFVGGHVGKPFKIRFTGNRTIVHGTPIFLVGLVNFAGTDNDTLWLELGSDGNYREVGRSVI